MEKSMTNRERFNNLFAGKSVDRVPLYEIGIWSQTAHRWLKEGMPIEALKQPDRFLHDKGKSEEIFSAETLMIDKPVPFFGLEHIEWTIINTYIPSPRYEEELISESEDKRTYIFRDCSGIVHKALREGEIDGMRMSMDQYIDFPVKDRESFLEIKKRYTASLDRYPNDWDANVKKWLSGRTDPLSLFYIGEFGYYSLLRRWMGTEGASYILYDDYKLVEEMFEFMTDYILELIKKAIDDMKQDTFDFFHIFEDMCFNNGPLMSPQMVKQLIIPQYRRLIDFLHKHGIYNILLDCDGDIKTLMPLWLDAGINGIMPMECKAGSDPITMRKEFGNDFFMIGGIAKHKLAVSKEEILDELSTKLDYLLPIGRYIPTLDHSTPPDVPYENFLYYIKTRAEIIKR